MTHPGLSGPVRPSRFIAVIESHSLQIFSLMVCSPQREHEGVWKSFSFLVRACMFSLASTVPVANPVTVISIFAISSFLSYVECLEIVSPINTET